MSPLFLSREIDGGGNTRPGVGAHRALGAAFRVQATLSKPGEVSVFSLGELVLGENPTPFGPEPNAFRGGVESPSGAGGLTVAT
jgi:hypothetical protein